MPHNRLVHNVRAHGNGKSGLKTGYQLETRELGMETFLQVLQVKTREAHMVTRMFEVKNLVFVLMLWGLCSASPEMFESPEMVNKVAKLLTEECTNSDVRTAAGFANFLQSVKWKLCNLIIESMKKTYGDFSKPPQWMSMPPGWNSTEDDIWWKSMPPRWNSTEDDMWGMKGPHRWNSTGDYMWWKSMPRGWNSTEDDMWWKSMPPGWNSTKDDMWWKAMLSRWNSTEDDMWWMKGPHRWNSTWGHRWNSTWGYMWWMKGPHRWNSTWGHRWNSTWGYMWWMKGPHRWNSTWGHRWNSTWGYMWGMKGPHRWNSTWGYMWGMKGPHRWNSTGDYMWWMKGPHRWNSTRDYMWGMEGPHRWNSTGDYMWGMEGPYRWNSTGDYMWPMGVADKDGPMPKMNISMFLHILYYTLRDDEYGSALERCVEGSRSSEMAWTTIVSNFSRLPPDLLPQLLWGARGFLLKAELETFRRLPSTSNFSQIELMMEFFGERYQELSNDARREIFQWARRSLVAAQCQEGKDHQSMKQTDPPPSRRTRPPPGNCEKLQMNNNTLEVLGMFIFDAPDEDFARVRPQQVCDLFYEEDFPQKLPGMEPKQGKRLLALLKVHCDRAQLRNITRLGALACFYDEAESLDKETAEALLTYLKSCKNKNAQKNLAKVFKDLAKKQPLDKEFLQKMGPSASALSSRQIANISDRDIPDIISNLSQGKGWSKRQSKMLINKFLRGGGQVSSSSDLVKMGSLVRGLNSKVLRNVSGEQLLQAAKAGLEEEAREMSPFQRRTIVTTILQGVNSTTALESLSGLLVKELPLQAFRTADVRNLQNLTEKPWNQGQALYLCKIVLTNGSMTPSEFSQLGPLTQGVTCEMLATYSDQFGTQMGQALGNTTWLSRSQLTCAGQKLKDTINKLPASVNSQTLDTLSNTIPSAILLYLGEQAISRVYGNNCSAFLGRMAEVDLQLLPWSSPVRGLLLDRALRCLNLPLSALNGKAVTKLGALVCGFTGQNITELPEDAFNASLQQLIKCKQFCPTARSILARRLLQTQGDASQWTSDTVTSLGPMITLLDEQTLLQLANTSDVKEALLDVAASLPSQPPDTSPEFQTGFHLGSVRKKIFQILQQELAAEAGARRRRAASPCPVQPSSEEIQELGEANSEWSAAELACMSAQTFEDTVDVLGAVGGFSKEQLLALKDKAIETWGPVSGFTPDNIAALNCISTTLLPSELGTLDLSSIDTLDAISACQAWTQEQRSAVLERCLTLSGITATSMQSFELSGLGIFACAMNPSFISQLQDKEFSLAAGSLGKLPCGSDTLDALKAKAVRVFGSISDWKEADFTELGTIAAGASAKDLKSLDPTMMPFISSQAMSLIPADRFPALSVSQLKKLSPESAASITEAQLAQASEEQRAAVREALGIPTMTKTSSYWSPSHSPGLGSFRLSGVTQALLTLLLLLLSLPLSP
ncbi:otoancorin-like [Pristis pectinata]|uniref:otoancorin-like n=1 Tax=Pristis pectinata TaxID=685728 RepID=UPI00223D6AC9|nr:otoancorin-like [Pristis pectinata]